MRPIKASCVVLAVSMLTGVVFGVAPAYAAPALTTRKVLAGFNSPQSLQGIKLYGSGVSLKLNTNPKFIHSSPVRHRQMTSTDCRH